MATYAVKSCLPEIIARTMIPFLDSTISACRRAVMGMTIFAGKSEAGRHASGSYSHQEVENTVEKL